MDQTTPPKCKRCGLLPTGKVFAYGDMNKWDEASGMHAGCKREQEVEDAAHKGFHDGPRHTEAGGESQNTSDGV